MNRKYTSWVLIFFLVSTIFSGLLFSFDSNMVEGVGLIEMDTAVAEFTTANRQITIGSDGTLYVAYVNETNYNVFFEKSTDSGTTWNGIFNLSGSLGKIDFVCIAIDGNNKIYVAYQASTGAAANQGSVYVNWSTDSGSSWSGQKVTDATSVANGVAITVTNDNDVFVFGSFKVGNDAYITYRKFTHATSIWSGELTLYTEHRGHGFNFYSYDAVALSNDSILFFYIDDDDVTYSDLKYFTLDSYLTISGPYVVYDATSGSYEASSCSVAVDFDDIIHIVYTRANGDSAFKGIYYTTISTFNILGSEESIHYDGSYTVDFATISYTYEHSIIEILYTADCIACSDETIFRYRGISGSWTYYGQAIMGSDKITRVESLYQRFPYDNVLASGIRFVFFNDTSDNLAYADSSMYLWYDGNVYNEDDPPGSGYAGEGYGYYTTINVYNESSPSVAIPDWSIVIYDSNGAIRFSNDSQNNPVVIYHTNYGLGRRYFQINATGYSTRTYYANILSNVDYVLNAFLPYSDDTNLYYIQVLNELDSPIIDVEVTITKQLNGSYQTIASGITNAYGIYSVYLISGDSYKINLSKTGYTSLVMQDCMADPDNYGINNPIIYYLSSSSEPLDVVGFNNVILFCSESGWDTTNDTLHISFFDKLSETSDITIHVYESYETNLTFNYSYSYTDTYDIDIWVSGLNTSRMHRIKIISMNHTTLGNIVNKSCDIMPIHLADDAITETALEDAFRDVGGDFSMGYVNMFILFGPGIVILVGLGKADPGFGVLVSGMYFILCSWHINLIDSTIIAVLISMLIPLGIIAIAGKRGKRIT